MLYQLVKEYDLKVKAITFDNSYLTDIAKDNIEKTVNLLGVDHEYFVLDKKILEETYRLSINKSGTACLGCSFIVYYVIHCYAENNQIPYIFYGCFRERMFGKN